MMKTNKKIFRRFCSNIFFFNYKKLKSQARRDCDFYFLNFLLHVLVGFETFNTNYLILKVVTCFYVVKIKNDRL